MSAPIRERYTGAVMNTFGPPALALVRGSGAHVWDADGKEYVDLLAGIAVNALGHAHPALLEAVTTQLSTLGHVSNFFATEPQVRLAERLLTLLDWSDGRVFFSNSGTEANEAALKLTRRTGRTRLVAAEGSFHGRTMGALALTSKAAYREPFEPLPGEVTFVPYDDLSALAAAVDDTVAAVVLEPIQGEGGFIVPAPGFVAMVAKWCTEQGVVFAEAGADASGIDLTPEMVEQVAWHRAHGHELVIVSAGLDAYLHDAQTGQLHRVPGLGTGFDLHDLDTVEGFQLEVRSQCRRGHRH